MTHAVIGHNQSPHPLDEALAPYGDYISEAESWLDGDPVENERQMKSVDALLRKIKAAEKAVKDAEENEAKPIYDQWKAAKARYAPTLKDLDRIKRGLAATVNGFKQRLAEEKRAAERAAWEAAEKARREADAKARAANAADLEAQREVAAAKEAAMEAEKAAQAASKDQVKGLRTVKETVVLDQVALARYLWQHDRDALVEWQTERARKLGLDIPGVVEIRTRKEAY